MSKELKQYFFSVSGPSVATMLHYSTRQAKKHPSLIPFLVLIGARGTGAMLYVIFLELFNPDVSWDKKNNPELWTKLGPNEYVPLSECRL